MKKSIWFVLLLIITASSSQIYAQKVKADDILGEWFNQEKDGKVNIYEENGKFYGKIIWLKSNEDGKIDKKDVRNPDKKLQARSIVGSIVLNNFNFIKGEWKDGTIYDPKTGKTYSCNMQLENSNHLKIRGFIGVSWIGKTTHWTRD